MTLKNLTEEQVSKLIEELDNAEALILLRLVSADMKRRNEKIQPNPNTGIKNMLDLIFDRLNKV